LTVVKEELVMDFLPLVVSGHRLK